MTAKKKKDDSSQVTDVEHGQISMSNDVDKNNPSDEAKVEVGEEETTVLVEENESELDGENAGDSPVDISDEEVEDLIASTEDEVMRDALIALKLRHQAVHLKNLEMVELLQRQAAEFANFRKRVEVDKTQWRVSAEEDVLKNLLPILDSYESALSGDVKDEALKNYLEGFRFIYEQFVQLLKKHSIRENTKIGDEFDPNKHRALRFEKGEGDVDMVKEIYQKGYSSDDRILREATVLVEKKIEK